MKYIRKAGILLFWLAVWFAAGRIVENSLVLVGPEEVFMALGRLLPSLRSGRRCGVRWDIL